MKKTIFLVLAALLLVCASAGCIAEEEENVGYYERYYPYNDDHYYIYVDEETGVEYIYIKSSHGGIAPRYNADGTLRINEEFRK